MPKENTKDLITFLQPFPESVKEMTLWLREFIWNLYPDCNELIYDNYNALAIGFATTDKAGDAFCSLAVYSKYLNFGFNRGTEIADPNKILHGNGSLYRYIRIKEKNDFPKAYITKLLKDAYLNSLARLKERKQTVKGQTITKSISPVQRRPK
ncbi:MAG: DUF1801 domain-containing protein [Ginsengibacter sp.]